MEDMMGVGAVEQRTQLWYNEVCSALGNSSRAVPARSPRNDTVGGSLLRKFLCIWPLRWVPRLWQRDRDTKLQLLSEKHSTQTQTQTTTTVVVISIYQSHYITIHLLRDNNG